MPAYAQASLFTGGAGIAMKCAMAHCPMTDGSCQKSKMSCCQAPADTHPYPLSVPAGNRISDPADMMSATEYLHERTSPILTSTGSVRAVENPQNPEPLYEKNQDLRI